MKQILHNSLIALLFCVTSCTGKQTGLDIYLLIGQSNMAGRGIMTAADTVPLNNVLLFNDSSRFEPARHPLNKYSTVRKELNIQGINLGYEFGKTIESTTGHQVGLVVNARGGTSIREWKKGEICYDEAVRRTKEAMKYGTLKAILWHQGSADQRYPEKYMDKLRSIVTDLRTDFNNPELPFIVGQLGDWRESYRPFNKMIIHVADSIDHTSCVSTEGLTHIPGDSLHFDAESLNILGRRYAEKVLEMVYGFDE